ncbi:hypothetical protein [Pseudomonas sp. RGM 3321]|uniref:hypothetical protein n=1 Tax=Pseudomonas sp. RGM 3321 TaxID=2930089 RepID=UPI001FCBCD42|nr:hypothetical protein [Pseudomonas sp. RGM 3321]MCJ2372311.1 hypothetical protein [Pseudomonas sp. RGM 3321]
MNTYITINRPARSWSPIESNTKSNGFDIGMFAADFVRQDGQIITHTEGMDIIEQLTQTIADLRLEDISGLKPANRTKHTKRTSSTSPQVSWRASFPWPLPEEYVAKR